jgi:hypothetical protein
VAEPPRYCVERSPPQWVLDELPKALADCSVENGVCFQCSKVQTIETQATESRYQSSDCFLSTHFWSHRITVPYRAEEPNTLDRALVLAITRHELEHARQNELVPEWSALHQIEMAILDTRWYGRDIHPDVLDQLANDEYNCAPDEHDANATAGLLVRREYPLVAKQLPPRYEVPGNHLSSPSYETLASRMWQWINQYPDDLQTCLKHHPLEMKGLLDELLLHGII